MPFKTRAYLESLDYAQKGQLFATTTQLGYHPETGDEFLVPTEDRYGGTHILGMPRYGKSSFMESQAMQDILNDYPVFFIDPHGDSVDHLIAQAPDWLIPRMHLIDITDTQYPFGLNLLSYDRNDPLAQERVLDRLMHVFTLQWPDIVGQQYIPLYLKMATHALLDNPGSTLVDMYRFLDDINYRWLCLNNVQDQSVKQFWQGYENLRKETQEQHSQPLKTRLALMFHGRKIIRSIVGQKETTINFRRAIEDKEIILIKLPLKTLPQDAKLIGTLITAALHETLFANSNVLEDQRQGFSLYVDEFQNFASQDFSEMFTEGRKYKVKLTVANQMMSQLPPYLQDAVKTAYTKVCFRLTHDDTSAMSPYFITGEATVKPENIEPKPVEWLLKYGSDSPQVQTFIDHYLLPLQSQKRSGQVEIEQPGVRWEHASFWALNIEAPKDKPREADPTPYLNNLLYEVMKNGNPHLQIPSEIVWGFANCGYGFYSTFKWKLKGRLLSSGLRFPDGLVVENNGAFVWVRLPEDSREQLYHFLYHLRATMAYLALSPLGKKTLVSPSEISRMLISLPRRAAFVCSGDDVGVVYTDDTLQECDEDTYLGRWVNIKLQTRKKYCHEVKDLQPQSLADQDTQPTQAVKPQVRQFRQIKEVK